MDSAYRDTRNSPIMTNMGIEKSDKVKGNNVNIIWEVTSVNYSNGMATIKYDHNKERVSDTFFKTVEKVE